jgi:peptide/nickel transport system substrate-binding protein
LLLAIGATVLDAACTVRTPPAAQDRTLRIGARATAEARRVLRSFLFAEGLLAVDWQGRPSARLATKWHWENDGLTLRVQLRPDVRFHDGTLVTAPAVVKILKQNVPKPQLIGFEAVKSIDAPDSGSLLIHLSRPDSFLTTALATTLVVDDDKPDVGTGPFRLVPQSENLEAVQNTSYYRGTPGIERVKLIQYPTSRATWVGLLKTEIDMALEINSSVEFLAGATKFQSFSSIQPFYIPLVFNFRNPILARPEVRRAISDAINRKEIVTQGMRGRGREADANDPVWPSHWAYNVLAPRPVYSPDGARQRLDAAGLPVRPAVPGQRASRFQLKCLFYNVDPQFERIGLLLQRQLAAVGIDLVLEGVTEKELVRRLGAGQFDSYLFQLTSGRDVSWAYRFWHSPKGALGPVMQNTGYNGADTALDLLRRTREDDEVPYRIAVGDLRQRFYDDVPAVILAWTQITRAVDARFDVGNPNDPEIFANLWRWQLASPRMASR